MGSTMHIQKLIWDAEDDQSGNVYRFRDQGVSVDDVEDILYNNNNKNTIKRKDSNNFNF